MLPKIEQIKFQNQTLPKSNFDLVSLKELLSRGRLQAELTTLHQVNFYILLLGTNHQGCHTIDFTDYSYQQGTVLSIRKDQIHKFHLSKAEGLLFFFTDDFIASYLEQQEALKALQLFNELLSSPKIQLTPIEYADILQLGQHIQNEYTQVVDDYSLGIIRSLLHILIAKLYRAKAQKGCDLTPRKYLTEFIAFQKLVETNCFKTKKVMDYAQTMGCSTKTLNNIVQEIVHKSAKNFINELIVTKIKRLLIHSSASIKEIAYTAGFDEPTNFYKFFKKYTQSSPEAFRKAHL